MDDESTIEKVRAAYTEALKAELDRKLEEEVLPFLENPGEWSTQKAVKDPNNEDLRVDKYLKDENGDIIMEDDPDGLSSFGFIPLSPETLELEDIELDALPVGVEQRVRREVIYQKFDPKFQLEYKSSTSPESPDDIEVTVYSTNIPGVFLQELLFRSDEKKDWILADNPHQRI